jgi:hypothetical protein
MSEKSNLRPRVTHGTDEKLSHGQDELGPNTEIGSKLRALYSSIQDEIIPDRFLDLLDKLDQAERSHSNDDAQTAVPATE